MDPLSRAAAALPSIVTAGFATQYVSSLGLANSAGRAGWALASDTLGSRNTYFVFGAAVPLVAMIPSLAHGAAGGSGVGTLTRIRRGVAVRGR